MPTAQTYFQAVLAPSFVAALAMAPVAACASTSISNHTFQLDVRSGGSRAQLVWGSLRARVEQWTKLPDDWDGNYGQPLSVGVSNAAESVLAALQAQGLPVPSPYIAGDGEVGFRWQLADGFASISLLEDGHVVAFARSSDGKAPYRLDEPYSDLVDLTAFAARVADLA